MSYGSDTFWDIYSYTLHPISGSVVFVVALAVFIAGIRDDRQRRLFWVVTILAVSLLGFWFGEWNREADWLSRWREHDGNFDPVRLDEWMTRSTRGRMMFMAQAVLAVTFALALLWWPIRSKDDS